MARETKHTPGKWIVKNVDGFNEVYSENGSPICLLAVFSEGFEGNPKQDESEANARLISKAPAMYEMLKELADNPSFSGHLPTTRIKVLELIKKIEG